MDKVTTSPTYLTSPAPLANSAMEKTQPDNHPISLSSQNVFMYSLILTISIFIAENPLE